MRSLHRLGALLIFLTFLFLLPLSRPQSWPSFPSSQMATILLPVELEGKRYQFMLDTGSTNTIYDSTFLARLGDPIGKHQVETGSGSVQLTCYHAPAAWVGKMPLRTNQPIYCADLTFAREGTGHQIMGIVGLDFLRQHRIRLDFDAGKLDFLDKLEEEPGTPVPLILHRCYHVKVSVAGEEEQFMIDTGCVGYTSGDLDARLCERLARERNIQKLTKGTCLSLSGTSEFQTIALNTLALGPFTHHQLHFGQSRENILGLGYISRYIVTFDFPNQKMYLKRGKRFHQPEVYDESGLGIHCINGQMAIQTVSPGSSAERADIKPKDTLLKLDNLPADKTRMHVLRQQLARENETVRLRFRRGDEKREVELKLGK